MITPVDCQTIIIQLKHRNAQHMIRIVAHRQWEYTSTPRMLQPYPYCNYDEQREITWIVKWTSTVCFDEKTEWISHLMPIVYNIKRFLTEWKLGPLVDVYAIGLSKFITVAANTTITKDILQAWEQLPSKIKEISPIPRNFKALSTKIRKANFSISIYWLSVGKKIKVARNHEIVL